MATAPIPATGVATPPPRAPSCRFFRVLKTSESGLFTNERAFCVNSTHLGYLSKVPEHPTAEDFGACKASVELASVSVLRKADTMSVTLVALEPQKTWQFRFASEEEALNAEGIIKGHLTQASEQSRQMPEPNAREGSPQAAVQSESVLRFELGEPIEIRNRTFDSQTLPNSALLNIETYEQAKRLGKVGQSSFELVPYEEKRLHQSREKSIPAKGALQQGTLEIDPERASGRPLAQGEAPSWDLPRITERQGLSSERLELSPQLLPSEARVDLTGGPIGSLEEEAFPSQGQVFPQSTNIDNSFPESANPPPALEPSRAAGQSSVRQAPLHHSHASAKSKVSSALGWHPSSKPLAESVVGEPQGRSRIYERRTSTQQFSPSARESPATGIHRSRIEDVSSALVQSQHSSRGHFPTAEASEDVDQPLASSRPPLLVDSPSQSLSQGSSRIQLHKSAGGLDPSQSQRLIGHQKDLPPQEELPPPERLRASSKTALSPLTSTAAALPNGNSLQQADETHFELGKTLDIQPKSSEETPYLNYMRFVESSKLWVTKLHQEQLLPRSQRKVIPAKIAPRYTFFECEKVLVVASEGSADTTIGHSPDKNRAVQASASHWLISSSVGGLASNAEFELDRRFTHILRLTERSLQKAMEDQRRRMLGDSPHDPTQNGLHGRTQKIPRLNVPAKSDHQQTMRPSRWADSADFPEADSADFPDLPSSAILACLVYCEGVSYLCLKPVLASELFLQKAPLEQSPEQDYKHRARLKALLEDWLNGVAWLSAGQSVPQQVLEGLGIQSPVDLLEAVPNRFEMLSWLDSCSLHMKTVITSQIIGQVLVGMARQRRREQLRSLLHGASRPASVASEGGRGTRELDGQKASAEEWTTQLLGQVEDGDQQVWSRIVLALRGRAPLDPGPLEQDKHRSIFYRPAYIRQLLAEWGLLTHQVKAAHCFHIRSFDRLLADWQSHAHPSQAHRAIQYLRRREIRLLPQQFLGQLRSSCCKAIPFQPQTPHELDPYARISFFSAAESSIACETIRWLLRYDRPTEAMSLYRSLISGTILLKHGQPQEVILAQAGRSPKFGGATVDALGRQLSRVFGAKPKETWFDSQHPLWAGLEVRQELFLWPGQLEALEAFADYFYSLQRTHEAIQCSQLILALSEHVLSKESPLTLRRKQVLSLAYRQGAMPEKSLALLEGIPSQHRSLEDWLALAQLRLHVGDIQGAFALSEQVINKAATPRAHPERNALEPPLSSTALASIKLKAYEVRMRCTELQGKSQTCSEQMVASLQHVKGLEADLLKWVIPTDLANLPEGKKRLLLRIMSHLEAEALSTAPKQEGAHQQLKPYRKPFPEPDRRSPLEDSNKSPQGTHQVSSGFSSSPTPRSPHLQALSDRLRQRRTDSRSVAAEQPRAELGGARQIRLRFKEAIEHGEWLEKEMAILARRQNMPNPPHPQLQRRRRAILTVCELVGFDFLVCVLTNQLC